PSLWRRQSLSVATAMDGLVFGEPQEAAFYRTTYTRFLKFFIYFLTSVRKTGQNTPGPNL
ncbi:hypothetical protein, partial [Sporolactobacillus inulinus]|uniref:hypothetical protein n=1 Tax=Sporolactobacillus inulinus TaxID=2078 RepID=UPI001ED9C67D